MKLEIPKALPTTIILILSLFWVALRFLHLDADFPLGISWSGDLYTDEGWYANAATREVVSGQWYLAGDFNPAVNLPMAQLLQRAAFGLFGMSLFSVRLCGALASSAVILLAGLFVRRGASLEAGLLTSLILASSYIGFAYSRLAILEPIGLFFVMAALCLSQETWSQDKQGSRDKQGRRALAAPLVCALLVSAAALVKGSMIFAVPVVGYAVWLHGRGWRRQLLSASSFLLTSCVVIGGWQVLARHFFAADYTYFNSINLGARQVTGIADWMANLQRQYWNMLRLGPGFVKSSVILVLAAAAVSPKFRSMPMTRILVVYAVTYFGLLSIVSYGPARYFLPLLVPLAGLSATACVELVRWSWQTRPYRMLALLPSLLVVMVVVSGCGRIVSYMDRPQYSFLRMATGVRNIINHREGHASDVVLLGQMADSVSLETGTRALNTRLGTLPLDGRLQRYRPSYALVHTDEAEVIGAIRASGGQVTKLGAWDVYGNYYGAGQDIQLFAINWNRLSQVSSR